MKYCEKCGNQLLDEAVMCPKCGHSINKVISQKDKKEIAKWSIISPLCFIGAIAIIVITILLVIAQYNSF